MPELKRGKPSGGHVQASARAAIAGTPKKSGPRHHHEMGLAAYHPIAIVAEQEIVIESDAQLSV